jgi:plastocyanin
LPPIPSRLRGFMRLRPLCCRGQNPHSVVADNGMFDSGLLYPGESYQVTFEGSGTVTYHCSPEMSGSVTVA